MVQLAYPGSRSSEAEAEVDDMPVVGFSMNIRGVCIHLMAGWVTGAQHLRCEHDESSPFASCNATNNMTPLSLGFESSVFVSQCAVHSR